MTNAPPAGTLPVPTRFRWYSALTVAVALVVGGLARSALWSAPAPSLPAPVPETLAARPPSPQSPTPSPERLAIARDRAALALDKQLFAWEKAHLPAMAGAAEARVSAFERLVGERAKGGASGFADELLGWGSTWQVVKSAVSSEAGAEHRAAVQRSFEKHVLRGEEFEVAIRRTVQEYIAEVLAAENSFLLALTTELANIPDVTVVIPALESRDRFDRALNPLLAKAMAVHTTALAEAAVQDIAVAAASTKLSEVVVSRVASALAVRTGVVTAGSVAGPMTFGLSLAVAVILDLAIDQAMRLAGVDAKSRVNHAVTASLEHVTREAVRGRAETWADYQAMQRVAVAGRTADAQALAREAILRIEASGQLGLKRDLDHLAAVRHHALHKSLEALIHHSEH